MVLHNKYDKQILRQQLHGEDFGRITLSFYRYVILESVEALRDKFYLQLQELNVFGRIYLAHEGINAQISVPEFNFEKFKTLLDEHPEFRAVDLKIAIEDDGKSFYKLIVRLRKQIVADGLEEVQGDGIPPFGGKGGLVFDVTNVGKHLSAKEFNEAMKSDNVIVVDMRNHYESEVGYFEGAFRPDADTFKQELPIVLNFLKDKKDKKILLYCTGGIRCEKASAFLKHNGIEDVNQLNGGIIHYARQVKSEGLQSKFIGKNFVFDDRLGERITEEIVSTCHQCGTLCDTHVNCANDDCHLLFIQCENCAIEMNGCCTPSCKEISLMPIDEQRKLRKGKIKHDAHSVYKSRLRPNLREVLKNS